MEENRGYFGDELTNAKVYSEIEAALDRIKNREIEDLFSDEHVNLDNTIERTEQIIEFYDNSKELFRSYIFEGEIPEDLFDEDLEEDTTEA